MRERYKFAIFDTTLLWILLLEALQQKGGFKLMFNSSINSFIDPLSLMYQNSQQKSVRLPLLVLEGNIYSEFSAQIHLSILLSYVD
ncbi:hypothetical protein DEO72_LG10g3497 [Vigna unguiculata]|uniref:Uncharacterized protein n=1 Tax=Vigna unguiculata TaxID=3917 RepID=A0A4D6NEZ6_VIGUN|nr:hypothetical protein DEO72_LG10g3497 [Vigna unguiculata]